MDNTREQNREQAVQKLVNEQIGQLVVQVAILTADLAAAREEIAALKAKEADNSAGPQLVAARSH